MKILIYSPLFYPSIGGIETVVSILAHEFVRQGHAVKLVSQTPDPEANPFPFEVIRQPGFKQLLALTAWCDVYFQGCISLKGIFPLLMTPKPLLVTHQTWYRRTSGKPSWQDYLKQGVAHFATNIAASSAVAKHLSAKSTVIPNPYREELFYQIPEVNRDRNLIFLGRLVSDKGADLLLDALAHLKHQGLTQALTIVGKGPEESNLKAQARQLGIHEQVEFVGAKVGEELVQLLNAHQILVVPSRWQEPFGIVALEGIACGCLVVGSEGGGLKEAIGPCGITFSNGDVQALAEALAHLLSHPEQLASCRASAPTHLVRHHSTTVAKAYLEVFETALK
jgi:glycogen synthase